VEEKLGADLRISELAKVYGSSLHVFSRAFSNSTKITAKEYINRRLNQEALQLVIGTDIKVKEIADRLRTARVHGRPPVSRRPRSAFGRVLRPLPRLDTVRPLAGSFRGSRAVLLRVSDKRFEALLATRKWVALTAVQTRGAVTVRGVRVRGLGRCRGGAGVALAGKLYPATAPGPRIRLLRRAPANGTDGSGGTGTLGCADAMSPRAFTGNRVRWDAGVES